MGQIKAQDINWLDEAWSLSNVIARLPSSNASGGLLNIQPVPPTRQIDAIAKECIEVLQSRIALHLAYRLLLVHKLSFKRKDGLKGMFIIEDRDPAEFIKAYDAIAAMGVKFTRADFWAIDAHTRLGHVLIDGYVCDEWKRLLPLIVASIGGDTASQSAAQKASRPRPGRKDRNAELREAKSNCVRNNPGESWKETLRQLQGDGCVLDWTDKVITWRTSEGETRTTRTSTFMGWLKEW